MSLASALVSVFLALFPGPALATAVQAPVVRPADRAYVLPWRTYEEAAQHMAGPPTPACGGIAAIVGFDNGWAVLSTKTRDVWVEMKDDKPVRYVFTITSDDSTTWRVDKVLSRDQYVASPIDPCAYVQEVGA